MRETLFMIIPTLGVGGGEKLLLELARNINRDKFEVIIICFYSKKNTIYEKLAEDSNIEVIYLNKKLGFDFNIIYKLIKIFSQYKPAIVHTHNDVIPYVLSAAIFYRVRIKLHTQHSVANRGSAGISKIIQKLAFKFCGFTPVAICDYVRQTICDEYKIKLNKIPCIYNGVDTKKFIPLLNERNNEIVKLICTGTLYHIKNHKLLINSFANAIKKNPNITLEIIGDGDLKEELEEQIDSLGLKNNVKLLGIVDNVYKYLQSADIFILTSNIEGLPLSILEAMSCALPIITTRAGGVIDIVKNQENGIIVDVGDCKAIENAILRLSFDKELRKEMSSRSLEMSKKYDIRICTAEYEKLYDILGKKR